MKQLLLITALSTLALTGCNSVHNPFKADSKPMVTKPQDKAHGEHHGEHEHGKKGHRSKPSSEHHSKGDKPIHHHHAHHKMAVFQYKCEQNANLAVKYDSDNEMATVKVTAPTLGLTDQDIQLKLAPSASGERYVNDMNPASVYEWHTNSKEGVFAVKANNKEYSLACNAVKPANHP